MGLSSRSCQWAESVTVSAIIIEVDEAKNGRQSRDFIDERLVVSVGNLSAACLVSVGRPDRDCRNFHCCSSDGLDMSNLSESDGLQIVP